jgi:hypothetical protein
MIEDNDGVSLGSIAQALRHQAMMLVEPDTPVGDLTDEEWLALVSVAIAMLFPAKVAQ